MEPSTTSGDVRKSELEEIRKRRDVVGLTDQQGGGAARQGAHQQMVGLALSGGGIRSACVGLGLLQALYRRGILRHVDYMSTVSGGGYIGSYMSSAVSLSEKEIDWEPESDRTSESKVRLPFYAKRGAPQSPAIVAMANRGSELNRPIKFLSGHLWGLILVNVFVISGLIAVGSLLAWLFRMLFLPESMHFLAALGFSDDLSRAFFPAFVAFFLWLVSMPVATLLHRRGLKAPWFPSLMYLLLVANTAMGLVVVFSTGNLDLQTLESTFRISKTAAERIASVLAFLSQVAIVAFSVSIMPYLNIKALIASGTRPKNRLHGWVFNVASYMLMFGAPLVVFYILSFENLSGHNSQRDRPYEMNPSHFKDWDGFWSRTKKNPQAFRPTSGAGNDSTKSASIVVKDDNSDGIPDDLPHRASVLENHIWQSVQNVRLVGLDAKPAPGERPGDSYDVVDEVRNLQSRISQRDNQTWMYERWLFLLGHITLLDKEFKRRWDDGRRLGKWKLDIVNEFNKQCLADPSFYRRISLSDGYGGKGAATNFDPDQELSDAEIKEHRDDVLSRLIARAKELEGEVGELPYPPNSDRTYRSPQYYAMYLGAKLRDATRWRFGLYQEQLADANYGPSFRSSDAQRKLHTATQEYERHLHLTNRVQRVNWNLVRAYFGEKVIHPQTEIFASVVTEKDQECRLKVFSVSAIAFLIIGICFSINPTLLHGFYRDQLAALWLYPKGGPTIAMKDMVTCDRGAPLHILNATVTLFGVRRESGQSPLQRFIFSRRFTGGGNVGFRRTSEYQRGECKLADAMAISGAAVSPTAIDSVLVRCLLVLFNIRMGKWMPNPSYPPGDLAWPSPLRLAWDLIVTKPQERGYLFVSDGGHTDNTGIQSLFDRRCRIIIACDSSQDGSMEFADLSKLLQTSQERHGIRLYRPGPGKIPFSLDELKPDEKTRLAKRHSLVLRIEYPHRPWSQDGISRADHRADDRGAEIGYLILIKPSLTGDEPPGLLNIRARYPEFPHDATLDQFFDSERFFAYRELGEHMGDTVCDELFAQRVSKAEEPWLATDWRPTADIDPANAVAHDVPQPAGLPVVAEVKPDDAILKDASVLSEQNADVIFALLRNASDAVRLNTSQWLKEHERTIPQALRNRTIRELLAALDIESDATNRRDMYSAIAAVDTKSNWVKALLLERSRNPHEDKKVREECARLAGTIREGRPRKKPKSK